MRLERLLGVVIYLLNHELAKASELAHRYRVSTRTIQRDMRTIEDAGIPLYTTMGSDGGYGIVDSWRIERRCMTTDDYFSLITSLATVAAIQTDHHFADTLEKLRGLVPDSSLREMAAKSERLDLDFSGLGGDVRQRKTHGILKTAIDGCRLAMFQYTNNHLETTSRVVEPMTLAFRWHSWYLFGFCRLRSAFRMFRISRIRDVGMLDGTFERRHKTLSEFLAESMSSKPDGMIRMVLRFAPAMRAFAEDIYGSDHTTLLEDGRLEVTASVPEDGGLYGHILSFGSFVEVVAPDHLRYTIKEAAMDIIRLYE